MASKINSPDLRLREAEFSNPSASGNFGVIGAIASNSLRGIILDTETGLIHILDKTGTKNFLENYPGSASGNFGVIGAIASNSLRGIILDTETGLIHILDKTGTKNFLENYPEELEKYLSSEKKLADRRKAILSINKKYNISTN